MSTLRPSVKGRLAFAARVTLPLPNESSSHRKENCR